MEKTTMYITISGFVSVVVIYIGWIFRNRLTEGVFKFFKSGIEARIKAKEHGLQSKDKVAVMIKGSFHNSSVESIAGQDIKNKHTDNSNKKSTSGVNLNGTFTKSKIKKIAGRDIIARDK